MSNKERAVQLLNRIPESRMYYVISFLEGAAIPDEIPNEETIAAFAEVDEMKRNHSGQKYYSRQFKKDYKNCIKRGLDIRLLQSVVSTLAIPALLPKKHREHALTGNYSGRKECHITPDWLLIYEIDGDDLYLDRTGTHSDLFKK